MTADSELNPLIIEPSGPATASIIWLHGLGADAHDFEPIVPHLDLPAELGVRFIFPNAPRRPVSVNNGLVMPAWYDILGLDINRQEDEAGIRDSERALQKLIRQQEQQGIATERIVLAGFSQGGAMTLHTGVRYPEKLAGMLALSCYLPLPDSVPAERHPANQDTAILMAHGRFDPVVNYDKGKRSSELLQDLGYPLEWREYPMQHEVVLEQIQETGRWLQTVLA